MAIHVEINNENKTISRRATYKLHSLLRDLTALKIESTIFSETPLTMYQSIWRHIPQEFLVCICVCVCVCVCVYVCVLLWC
jgi:hypothetical protein